MDYLSLLKKTEIDSLINERPRESKFGEHIHILSNLQSIYDQIKNLDVRYVIFGICEDIGIIANHGKQGASGAWEASLKILLNIQNNQYTHPHSVLILGKLEFPELSEKLKKWDDNNDKKVKKAKKMVSLIDKEVTDLVYNIIKAGKIPIAIGGGHNNSYGMLKGAAMARMGRINCVNLDAHSDFRPEEGRHSGNGFSYAFAEGFLKRYFIFGLHENYTSDNILKSLKKLHAIDFITFEEIAIRQKQDFYSQLDNAYKHMENSAFGVEIDCDAIKNIPSSAMTPTGFELEEARQFVHYFAKRENVQYLHICEAAPTAESEHMVGKVITYLITDFIKANAYRNSTV